MIEIRESDDAYGCLLTACEIVFPKVWTMVHRVVANACSWTAMLIGG